jgi:hypothetical protein
MPAPLVPEHFDVVEHLDFGFSEATEQLLRHPRSDG